MKTRLNQHHRGLLRTFANKGIACPHEQKIRDKAYAKAAKLVSEGASKKFPAADMSILAKYSVAEPDTCLRGGTPDGRFIVFNFDDADPLMPVLPIASCGSRPFAWNIATVEAVESFDKAQHALKKARAEKLEKYRALIMAARTFEEVVAVWPATETLREQIAHQSTALVALSNDVAQFIRTDNAGAALQGVPA